MPFPSPSSIEKFEGWISTKEYHDRGESTAEIQLR